MIKSFINPLLPKDEYKRFGVLYFFAESAVVVLVGLLVITAMQLFVVDMQTHIAIILLVTLFFLIVYPLSRYIGLGMEHTDLTSSAAYKKMCLRGIIQSVGAGMLFTFFLFMLNGMPTSSGDFLTFLVMPISFTTIFLCLTMISLKKSYKKNQELVDDDPF